MGTDTRSDSSHMSVQCLRRYGSSERLRVCDRSDEIRIMRVAVAGRKRGSRGSHRCGRERSANVVTYGSARAGYLSGNPTGGRAEFS